MGELYGLLYYALHEQRNHKIELHAALQDKDTTTGKPIVVSVKHIFVVQPKKVSPGKLALLRQLVNNKLIETYAVFFRAL